jgi:hypothetical protein
MRKMGTVTIFSAAKKVTVPILILVLLGVGCAPEDDVGPQVVRVLVRDGRDFELRDELLATLESAREVRGSVGELRGGGEIVLEETLLEGDLSRENTDDVQQAVLIKGDGGVEADYVHDGEVLVPRDYETLLLFTFYRHLERALTYYEELGVPPRALEPFTAYFYIRFTAMLAWGTTLFTDNAAYAPLVDGLLLFPSSALDRGVPLCANDGVVVHELGHGVKHRILSAGRSTPRYVDDDWGLIATNSYRADDEGLADFHAAVLTGDPDFIAPSIPGVGLDRDLREARQFTHELYEELSDGFVSYNPYPLGSALASFLWATAGYSTVKRLSLARTVIAALEALGPSLDDSYRLPVLLDAIMARAEPSLHDRGCALLETRLEAEFRDVPACGITP